MNTGTAVKIHLVRCPKCRKVLPELPNIPVYQCGGCGTTLQAKIRKQNSEITASSLPETNADETNNVDLVSRGEELSSSSRGTSPQSAGECSSNQNNERERNESGNFSGANLKGKNKVSEDENNASDGGSDDKFSGVKLEHDPSNDSQKIGSDNNEAENLSKKDHNNGLFMGVNLSKEECNNGSHHDDSLTGNIEQHGVSADDCSSNGTNGISHIENEELLQSPLVGANLEVEDNDEALSIGAKVEAEANANSGIDSTVKRSNQEKQVGSRGSTSTVATHQPLGESISSDIFISSPNGVLEQAQGNAHHGFVRARSRDAFDNTDFVNPSSELSGTLIDLSKSPTTRSARAYYDDGISSYEGTDDQVPNRHKHTSKHAYRAANHAVSDVRSRRGRFPISSNYEMQQDLKDSPPNLPERTHYPLKYSTLDQGEVLESTRLGHPGRPRRNLERGEYLPQHYSHTLAGYESGSTSNQFPNELYYNLNFSSQDKRGYTYQEKLKLLRMVFELQDQLKASLNDKANGRVSWKDHQIPMFYDHEVEPEESFHNLVYPRYSGGIRDKGNLSQQRKYSQMPFSAEAVINRHQVDHSLCCCPEDRKWSGQVPSSVAYRNKGFCRVHAGINPYSSYGSCPSSPQQYVDSEFPLYLRGTKSDDQRHKDWEVRKYLREKHHLPKRHFRPLAGGAPFITCPCCLKLLQLPADFLLFKRRWHQLKCGGCSEVLKFSLVNKTHLVPYMPVAEAPPPSEVDQYSAAIHRRNLTSTSHVTDCPSISCSDDCGHGYERKMSYDSFQHEERRRFSNGTPRKGKNPVETNESVGPSTSTSKSMIAASEIEELPAPAGRGGGSPLHRLMGYSSAREVIYGGGPSERPLVD